MLFNVHRGNQCPEGDVEIAFQNKSNAGNFNIVRFKPGNYLPVTILSFSCSFNAASEEFTHSQETSIEDH
jgi:hypothetical protein